jgi:hypothetical protein
MANKTQINYTVDRGEVWERLIIPKDRRTRRRRVPVEANASVKVGDTIYILPCEITSEGGIQLSMTAGNTEWLADGEYDWDMTATISRSALLTSTPLVEMVIVYGKLTVSTYNNLTPMDSDGSPVALVARP